MFLAPLHSDLIESLPTINLLGLYLGELAGKTPTQVQYYMEVGSALVLSFTRGQENY